MIEKYQSRLAYVKIVLELYNCIATIVSIPSLLTNETFGRMARTGMLGELYGVVFDEITNDDVEVPTKLGIVRLGTL
jgi:uncharacterized membrane protein